MPVQGLVRLRKHQFGRQADFGIAASASRAYAATGTPDIDLAWTDPEVDEGSIDPVTAPSREIPVLGWTQEFPRLTYNDLPLIMCGFFGGNVNPSGAGTAKTWAINPNSLTVDPIDTFTGEFGDDVLTDWFQLIDGVVESFEVTVPDGLAACSASVTWKFGAVRSTGSTDFPVDGTVPTPGLSVETDPAVVYGKDLSVFIADAVAGLGAGQILDAYHGGVIRGTTEFDEKRYANGSQSFDVDAYARASRSIECEFRFAKTADTVGTGSESDHWMSEESVARIGRFLFTSLVLAQAPATFYSWQITTAMRWYTRTEDAIGGNSIVVLTGHARYDPDDLAGVFDQTIVTTVSEEDLGS